MHGQWRLPGQWRQFFRLCKRPKTAPFLEKTNFAVCALGDSNYDAFCSVGKDFDKHFARLGGKRILKRVDVSAAATAALGWTRGGLARRRVWREGGSGRPQEVMRVMKGR